MPRLRDQPIPKKITFAIMGAYRMRELPNILPSATGARQAVRGGVVHLP